MHTATNVKGGYFFEATLRCIRGSNFFWKAGYIGKFKGWSAKSRGIFHVIDVVVLRPCGWIALTVTVNAKKFHFFLYLNKIRREKFGNILFSLFLYLDAENSPGRKWRHLFCVGVGNPVICHVAFESNRVFCVFSQYSASFFNCVSHRVITDTSGLC